MREMSSIKAWTPASWSELNSAKTKKPSASPRLPAIAKSPRAPAHPPRGPGKGSRPIVRSGGVKQSVAPAASSKIAPGRPSPRTRFAIGAGERERVSCDAQLDVATAASTVHEAEASAEAPRPGDASAMHGVGLSSVGEDEEDEDESQPQLTKEEYLALRQPKKFFQRGRQRSPSPDTASSQDDEEEDAKPRSRVREAQPWSPPEDDGGGGGGGSFDVFRSSRKPKMTPPQTGSELFPTPAMTPATGLSTASQHQTLAAADGSDSQEQPQVLTLSPPKTAGSAVALSPEEVFMQYDEAEVEVLRKIRPFARLTEYKLRQLRSRSTIRQYPRYQTIFREGSRCSSLMLVLKGQVQACSNNSPGQVTTYGFGTYFGLEAIVFGEMRRDATLEVTEDCEVLHFYAEDLKGLHIRLGECRATVVKNLLSDVAFFRGLSLAQCTAVSKISEIIYDEGEGHAVFERGAPSDAFYIVLEGRVGLYFRERLYSRRTGKPVDGPEVLKSECAPDMENPWLGDTAFLGASAPYELTARCLEPSKLLVVKTQHLKIFLENARIANSPPFDEMILKQRASEKALADSINSMQEMGL